MAERTVELSSNDVDILSDIVTKLGGYAKGLLDDLNLGISKSMLAWHIDEVHRNLTRLRESNGGRALILRPPGLDNSPMLDNMGDTWNYTQTLRFAAGATMISQRYQRFMSAENLRRSMLAKILYKCQTGILDDLVDTHRYSYIEAKDLYHHVLSSMTDPDFEMNAFKQKLISMMKQEQLGLFDLVTDITASFNEMFVESPHGHELFYQMDVLDERVTLGQALTMFQKESSLDTDKIRRIASRFYAPSDDLEWYDRVANYVSGGTRYNLIDISFCERHLDLSHINTLLEGWYYYDVVIVYLNNIVHIYQDLKEGIANLSLISLREEEVCDLKTLGGYNPRLTMNDYSNHIRRLAGYASRALEIVTSGYEDETLYYPFITVMMPVVMMADWIGKQDSFIGLYLDELSPALQRVAADVEEIAPEAAEAVV
ncbi:MAG: hypothetical protein KAU99_02285 [Thermoplasmata archaeon]|nr:hypothetical protein [Thermoplasmata archaeon]